MCVYDENEKKRVCVLFVCEVVICSVDIAELEQHTVQPTTTTTFNECY